MQSEFSSMLQYARKQAGLTQKDLASLLGVATGTVQQWELGVRFPRVEMLKKIEDTLQIALVPLDIANEKKAYWKGRVEKAWKAAEEKEGRKLTFDEAMEKYRVDLSSLQRMEAAFHKLNIEGRRIAVERVEELCKIADYTLPVIQDDPTAEPPETPTEGNAPITQEKPPEGPAAQPDGK